MALYLGRRHGGLRLAELSKAAAIDHYATVSAAIRRYREVLKGDRKEAKGMAQCEAKLAELVGRDRKATTGSKC